jgi:hypothetical protein
MNEALRNSIAVSIEVCKQDGFGQTSMAVIICEVLKARN